MFQINFTRKLQKVLKYKRQDKFNSVISNARIACQKNNCAQEDLFSCLGKKIELSKESKKTIIDYKLSRYAHYLIVQNTEVLEVKTY